MGKLERKITKNYARSYQTYATASRPDMASRLQKNRIKGLSKPRRWYTGLSTKQIVTHLLAVAAKRHRRTFPMRKGQREERPDPTMTEMLKQLFEKEKRFLRDNLVMPRGPYDDVTLGGHIKRFLLAG